MNTGLQSQIRAYGNQLVEDQTPITDADIVEFLDTIHELPAPPVPARSKPRIWVAVAAAAVVLVLLGVLPLLTSTDVEETPPVTEPPSTVTTVPGAVPDMGLGDVPAFQATVRYTYGDSGGSAYDDGAVVDVSVSYDPPDSFRRDIIAYEPEVMEIRFGQVGSHVATNETFPDLAYETFEEGEKLGPLVWSNWADACTHPPVAVATEDAGPVLLTVVECESADAPWVRAGTPWAIRVDASTGIVFDVEAELREGGEFRIPAERVEILDIDYTPQFTEDYFANLTPPYLNPPFEPFSEVPIAYTLQFPDGTELAVSWANDATWRQETTVVGADWEGDGWWGPGSYQVHSNGTEFAYNPDTNQYSEERRFEANWLLTVWHCDQSGTCRNYGEGPGFTCQMSEGGTVAGREVTRFDCANVTPFDAISESSGMNELTLWIDNELGYNLKSVGEGFFEFEVLNMNLEPSFGPGLFDQKCPTPDCTPAPAPDE